MPRTAQISLGPFGGVSSELTTDLTARGTAMRGGYNVEVRDGEWWTRHAESEIYERIGGVPWWWMLDVNASLSIIANAYYALAFDRASQGVAELYTAASTQNVTFTNGSATATPTSTRTVGQLILVGSGTYTDDVYRVTAATAAPSITLDRAFEGSTGTKSCRFIDPLARNIAGTAQTVSADSVRVGSCVVFEQLVTNSGAGVHAASPATTAGNSYLIITSNFGVPVAIDLTAYMNGATTGVLRSWFYNTAIGTPASIGANSAVNNALAPRGIYATVYKNRLFIGYATDPNGRYGDRTVWWSQIGDFCRWHTGIAGQTAAPNFKTFDGEGDEIAEVQTLGESLVVHRWYSQEIGSATGASGTPFSFRSNKQNIGIHDRYGMTNRVVNTGPAHYIWTRRGPAVFDGSSVSLIARRAYRALLNTGVLDYQAANIVPVHDERTQRIYWMLNGADLHQDATPTTNFITAFVYDYTTDESWFENRPASYGGGMVTWNADVPQAIISRKDGTILELCARNRGLDADYTDPSAEVAVYSQVDTAWLSFGSLARKTLTRVEVVLRSLDSTANNEWDRITGVDSGGDIWLRLRVYVDYNENTSRGDVGVTHDRSDSDMDDRVEFLSPGMFLLTFTPRVHGRVFKLRFSNGLTASATSEGYDQGPFRIAEVICHYTQAEGDSMITTKDGSSISE